MPRAFDFPAGRCRQHIRRHIGLAHVAGCACLMVVAGTAPAQQSVLPRAATLQLDRDVLAGRVTSARGPVPYATVTVQDVGGLATAPSRTARTDSSGRWLVAMQDATGDYTVRVIAFGFRPARTTAKRDVTRSTRAPIIVDITLESLATTLDVVKIVEKVRPRPTREVAAQDRSASERPPSTFAGAIAVGDQGNLASMASSTPGTLLTTDAGGQSVVTVLGLGADQNRTTMNGLSFGAGDIPRDAMVTTRIATTSYDVSRGGFSGGQIFVNIAPGTNFHTRLVHLTADQPAMQFAGNAGQRVGSEYTNSQFSGAVNGPIKLDRIFYNAAFQVGRRTSDLPSLSATNAASSPWLTLVADSVTRLLELLHSQGIAVASPTITALRTNTNASALGRMDWFRSPRAIGNVVVSAQGRQTRGTGVSAQSTPSTGSTTTGAGASLIAALSAFLPGNALNDLRISAHLDRSSGRAYTSTPSALILVTSAFGDSGNAQSLLQAGGSANIPPRSRNWGGEVYNMLSWFTTDRRHRFRALADFRVDALQRVSLSGQNGSYFYRSLQELSLNQPFFYTRSFGARAAQSSNMSGALSFGDDYRPTDRLQLMYGVRLDVNAFLSRPQYRADIAEVFGVRTDSRPRLVDLSPRIGFFKAFGHNGTSGIPGFGAPWGSVRGGIGLFRNDVAPALLLPVSASSFAGTRRLTCLGTSVPIPDWRRFAADVTSVPETCAGSDATPLTSNSADVSTIGRKFAAQRSWRGSFALNAFLIPKLIRFTAEGIFSLNLGQQSISDLNFKPSPQFTLGSEDHRPVYASAFSIVEATGALTNRSSRLNDRFGLVTERNGDLRSRSGQLVFTLFPAPGDALGRLTQWSASYSLQSVREQFRGFGGTTFNDPRVIAWGRGILDARHQIMLSATSQIRGLFSVAASARFTSGLPYTPLVSADINGDGFANDRAFVPRITGDDGSSKAMRLLLRHAPERAARCLERQLESVAAHNSCESTWSGMMNAAISVNPERLGWQNRVALSLAMTNVLAGIDQALHGSNNMRGWGQPVSADGVLLNVRGFDRTSKQFLYDVNGAFGDTRRIGSVQRAPFALTLEARVQLGHDFTSQSLDQALAPGRTRAGKTLTVDELKGALLESVYNPVRALLQARDSLSILTNEQSRQLTQLDHIVSIQQDSIVAPLAAFMATLPKAYDKRDLGNRLLLMQNKLFDVVLNGMLSARTVLTPEQIDELPVLLRASFNLQRLKRARPIAGFPVDY